MVAGGRAVARDRGVAESPAVAIGKEQRHTGGRAAGCIISCGRSNETGATSYPIRAAILSEQLSYPVTKQLSCQLSYQLSYAPSKRPMNRRRRGLCVRIKELELLQRHTSSNGLN